MRHDAGSSHDVESSHNHCVVIGVDAVSTRRDADPYIPIVALVDAASPLQVMLAQAAGADIALPVASLGPSAVDDAPGLGMAITAATRIAHRRRVDAQSSRRVGHDLSGSLNVIGLAAEVGATSAATDEEILGQISAMAREGSADAWHAGRTDRSSRRTFTAVDVAHVARAAARAVADAGTVELDIDARRAWVFADERQLTETITELLTNAHHADARRVRLTVDIVSADSSTGLDGGTDTDTGSERVRITVADDGTGLTAEARARFGEPYNSTPGSGRLGVGLATIVEFVDGLGGEFTITDAGVLDAADSPPWSTAFELSLPSLDDAPHALAASSGGADQTDILEHVVRNAPLSESLDAIVAAIEHQLPDTACSVLLLRDGRSLHHGAGAKLPAAYRAGIDGVLIGFGQGSCGTAAYTGRPVIATDVTTDPNWVRFRDLATEHGLRSCWSTPIRAAEGSEVLGTFAVYTTSVWGPGQAAIRLVQRFTYLAAVAIEHHRLFRALAESESRFRSAFEGASAGLAIVDLDGGILQANPSLSSLFGRSAERLRSTNLLELVDGGSTDEVRDSWLPLVDESETRPAPAPTIEVALASTSEAAPTWVSLSTSRIAVSGESNLYVEVRDITARRRHLESQRAREAAEASNRAKTDFLALVSHELRTPLNAILGFAQVMQLTDLDDAQRDDSVDQIVRAGEHLRDLIDELLDLSRIEAGQLSVQVEAVDPAVVISEAIDLVAPLAASRQIALAFDRGQIGDRSVVADRRCFRQVMINLLGNAVKYTPAGGRVGVDVRAVGTETLRITVDDTGPGIDPESIAELFTPFRRLERDRRAHSEGTGLGLALSARLMAEMNGEIGVDSVEGAGSSFWVEFPSTVRDGHDALTVGSAETADKGTTDTASNAHEKAATADAVPGEQAQDGGVVLYVENDEACVRVIEAAFALRPDIELRTACDATAGAAEFARGDVDLVLLDIGLPDRSGWDLLAELRADDPDLPALVLTAGSDVVPVDAPSPTELLTKPIDIVEALRSVDVALLRATSRDDIAETVDAIE